MAGAAMADATPAHMNRAAAAAMIVFIVLFRIDRRHCPGPAPGMPEAGWAVSMIR
jgi:hypothetical protein